MGLGPFILGAAGIQGATSVAGGNKGASAATDAANVQAQSAREALALQQQIRQQNVATLQPFVDYGTGGIPALNEALNTYAGQPVPTDLPQFTAVMPQFGGLPAFTMQPPAMPTEAELEQTPGYQFVRDQSLLGAQSRIAAVGRGRGGPAIQTGAYTAGGIASQIWPQVFQTKLAQYQAGLQGYEANVGAQTQTYQEQLAGWQMNRDTFLQNVQNLLAGRTMNLQQRNQIVAQLAGRVGTGLSAGGALAGSNLQYANAAGNYITGVGAAQASGIVGGANSLTAGLTGVGSAATSGIGQYLGYNLAQQYLQ